MINNITFGQYFPGNSVLHRLDPRTKIVGTLLFISSIFLAEKTTAYTVILAFIIFAVIVSGISLRTILRSFRPLWIILVFTLGIHMFSTPGLVLYAWGPLTLTQEGLRQGIFMSSRLLFLIVISSLLTFTTSPIVLTDGIERLLSPFRKIGFPAHELAMMMTIALRFIPTLLEETDRIMKAQMARGADFSSGSIIRRAQNMIPLLIPLFISAFRRADELATAMEARCYRGGENRTRMKELMITWLDGVAVMILLLMLGVLGYLRWWQ
ncbi:MAG: transporter transrane protein EcfT [Firmicutes bacterium]|nr:transporter transrane protein EcfT [Bacillota bacterium]